MINIIASFYVSKIPHPNIEHRNQELVDALLKNVQSPFVEKVHLFVDDDVSEIKLKTQFQSYIDNEKIHIIEVGKKPLYSDLFRYAITQLPEKICMVTNSDIYIHNCEQHLIDLFNTTPNLLYALTRHEHDMSCKLIDKYQGSHDSFVFKSPININILDKLNFVQHKWGSENKLIAELYRIGMKIANPCKQFIIVHLHSSEIREEGRWYESDGHSPDNVEVHFPPIIIPPP